MPTAPALRRTIAALVATGLALLLTGCLFSPGKFVSNLDLRRDGQFTFSYQGEIFVLPLSKLADKEATATEFTHSPCQDFDNDGNMVERACTADELASQKDEWQAGQDRAGNKRRQDTDQMRALTGGIDPSDPRAAEELAERLRRQDGYRSVVYKGDGLYLVDYSIASRLTHGFSFPAIEGFAMGNAFVQLSARQDDAVRLDAPGFIAAGGGNPMAAMMMGLPGQQAGTNMPKLPVPQGTFTLTTDATILANNTDAGSQPVDGGQKLVWTIGARTLAAPMALIRLAP